MRNGSDEEGLAGTPLHIEMKTILRPGSSAFYCATGIKNHEGNGKYGTDTLEDQRTRKRQATTS